MHALLLLADSRLPSGGHGHSGGVEALVDRGLVRSVDDLVLFLEGRLRTGGRVVAAAAAAACALSRGGPELLESHFHATSLQESGFPEPGRSPDRAQPGRSPDRAQPGRSPDRVQPGRSQDWAQPGRSPDWARWDAAVSARTP